jgi:hypothetical protein
MYLIYKYLHYLAKYLANRIPIKNTAFLSCPIVGHSDSIVSSFSKTLGIKCEPQGCGSGLI